MTSARFPREVSPQVYPEVDAGPRGIDVDEIQAHLPEEPNSFIGRERELGELSQLLSRTRALTLCGPGGIGKTRLALRLLSVVSGEGSAAGEEFPDGVWFVELADLRQPEQVALRIAAVTGITEEAGRPLLETLGGAAAAADAAGPGQLRAPARGVRPGRPAPAGQCTGTAAAGHQPGAAVGRGRDHLAGAAALGGPGGHGNWPGRERP